MHFNPQQLTESFQPEYLARLDTDFLRYLASHNQTLHRDLNQYRKTPNALNPLQTSELIIAAGKLLDEYLIDYFDIQPEAEALEKQTTSYTPIFAFKKWYVQRRAKRRLLRDEDLPDFNELNAWLKQQTDKTDELSIAQYALPFLDDKDQHTDTIEKIVQWCIQAIKTPEGRTATQGFISLIIPNKTDYKRLIPIHPVKDDTLNRQSLADNHLRQRDGFELTDKRMPLKRVMSEIDYCIYCHDHDGDFCSKGFPEKKSDPSLGLKKNALDNILTGCPLDEKISEMNLLKKEGYALGALATIMIDNPMCPATGHRICNDCMKACIYQKQDPVDIPQIETRILTDALDLPWGVEIYDLLTRWNPLRPRQHTARPYNGLKVFIAGQGPAGFTLAHHLLMEGYAVVGTDGLKIEPLPEQYINQPIKSFASIKESLADRLMAGFGGVAEYGITVRWDKNFLKLIYITLSRRPHMQIFGGVRFGGTVTVEDIWELGFDHAVIAVGAGLPKALPVKNSMARGMRQANDFLMALQLTGAAKENSLANLQLRLPAVVIGGGLTGVDTATEAQAYYIVQIEKSLKRYETLCKSSSVQTVRASFDAESLEILDEFIQHAQQVREERARASKQNEQPDLIKLIRSWGGVTIIYRRSIQESPAYTKNHEELGKALEEGIYYAQGLQPTEAQLDQYAHVSALVCQTRSQDEDGNWHNRDKTITIPAKSILVATGAQPNIAYTFEHPKVFKRNGLDYQNYEIENQSLHAAPRTEHLKTADFGPFTSYDHEDKHVSFIGDTHPVFHGNVVSAIASALRTYPKIVKSLDGKTKPMDDYPRFSNNMTNLFTTYIKSIEQRSDNVTELTIHAPMAAKKYQPGQFYRFQNYETYAETINNTLLQTEPMALAAYDVDTKQGDLKLMVIHKGASSQICARLKARDPIALMGPTGVRSKIPEDQQTILIIGELLSIAYLRAVTPYLKAKNNRVIYIGQFKTAKELFCQAEIEVETDLNFYTTEDDTVIKTTRKQDRFIQGDAMDALKYLADHGGINLNQVDRITLVGATNLLKKFQATRHNHLQKAFKPTVNVYGSIYSSMQCMLKGVCAQCLQWQIDPETGHRKKAIFTCSWQDQPIELVDLDNLDERLGQNRVTETLSRLYLAHTSLAIDA